MYQKRDQYLNHIILIIVLSCLQLKLYKKQSSFYLSTQSLDRVISTYQVQDRGTQQATILGLWGANGVGSLPGDSSFGFNTGATNTGLTAVAAAAGEYGTYTKSFPFGLTVGWPELLNTL